MAGSGLLEENNKYHFIKNKKLGPFYIVLCPLIHTSSSVTVFEREGRVCVCVWKREGGKMKGETKELGMNGMTHQKSLIKSFTAGAAHGMAVSRSCVNFICI